MIRRAAAAKFGEFRKVVELDQNRTKILFNSHFKEKR